MNKLNKDKKDKNDKNPMYKFVDEATLDEIKKINILIKTKKKMNINNVNIRKKLPAHKCIEPINKVNFCIYFLIKISIFLFNEKIDEKKLNGFLNGMIQLLHKNIINFKTTYRKYYSEELHENFRLYSLEKGWYENEMTDASDVKGLMDFLGKDLPKLAKSQLQIDYCNSSFFIWKDNNEPEIIEFYNDTNNNNNNNINNSINELQINDNDATNINGQREENNRVRRPTSVKNVNEIELQKIKDDLRKEGYYNNYFSLLDNPKNRCLILSPKNVLIKRIFSHIFYNLIFYDNTFLIIKNRYLRTFPEANRNTKQLNYPSKVKNFSNFYEPKLFLTKDSNFYNSSDKYFQISHDFLFKKIPTQKTIDESKKKEVDLLIKSTLSSVNFYTHTFNINDILEEKDSYFDCELVTHQFLYNGYVIFGKDYIYFGTKSKAPLDLNECKKGNYDLDTFQRFCFSTSNRDNITEKKKRIIMFYHDIKNIIRRRVLLMYQSIEIFCKNGKSYFFNLFRKDHCDNAFKILKNINEKQEQVDKFLLLNENITNQVKRLNSIVKNREINNYIYLLKINLYSSRTFNDVSQYPVFPWIILDFSTLDDLLNEEKNYLMQIENTDKEIPIDNKEKTTNNKEKLIDNKEKSLINGDNQENETINDDIGETTEDTNIETLINQNLYEKCGLRVFSYPLSMQNKEKRNNAIEKYLDDKNDEDNEGKFIYHHGGHYSNSSYVYFFLMRNNPFTQCMIKLQNYAKENPNRLFISFSDTLIVFKSLPENRELIPNLFCHFDYLCNLNCAYNGHKASGDLVDDLYDNTDDKKYGQFMFSKYAYFVYLFRKLLNSNLVSNFLPYWIDNIFGKNQLPDDMKKRETSCNIFNKSTYEEKMKLDKKLEKYVKKINNCEMDLKTLANKILLRIDLINNFGVTPHKVLDSTIKLKTLTRYNYSPNVFFEIIDKKKDINNSFIYFIKYNNEKIIILFNFKNKKESKKAKKVFIWNPNILIKDNKFENLDKISYPCGNIKQLEKISVPIKNINNINDINNKNNNIDNKNPINIIPIFKPCYSMSTFTLNSKLFIVTCRYLGNIFKVQKNNEKYLDVLCEDFVTCVLCKQDPNPKIDDIFIFTGLRNGKLIEWFVKEKKNENIPNEITIKEKRSNYFHKSEITCIELYENQGIIITGGKDKMIYIRKTFDFELLTVINLIHLYANPIIGEKIHIVPTLIKVSELNNVYVMLYNYESKKSFIRGYNLNGLYFAQSEEDDYMNICFTENCNLLVSFYNKNVISVLQCFDLKKNEKEPFEIDVSSFLKNNKRRNTKRFSLIKVKKDENQKNENNYLVWVDYNYKEKEFILLFKDKIVKGCIEDQEKQIMLGNY